MHISTCERLYESEYCSEPKLFRVTVLRADINQKTLDTSAD